MNIDKKNITRFNSNHLTREWKLLRNKQSYLRS